ncbi:MAG: hypothetical protein ACFCBU_11225 [Cyanophyceae cyanobacterium]
MKSNTPYLLKFSNAVFLQQVAKSTKFRCLYFFAIFLPAYLLWFGYGQVKIAVKWKMPALSKLTQDAEKGGKPWALVFYHP